jgi:hypothetical protein
MTATVAATGAATLSQAGRAGTGRRGGPVRQVLAVPAGEQVTAEPPLAMCHGQGCWRAGRGAQPMRMTAVTGPGG